MPGNHIDSMHSLISFPQSSIHWSLGSALYIEGKEKAYGIPEITHVTTEGFGWVRSGAASPLL